jgi:hypothetical protein
MKASAWQRVRVAVLVTLSIAVAACGGGGDDVQPPSEESPPSRIGRGWIEISSPTQASSYTTASPEIRVSGSAFVDGDGYRCCSGSASDTGVHVGWANAAQGSGSASQSVEYCRFYFGPLYLCRHTWSAWIPLVVGENLISVSAHDAGNNAGLDRITIVRLPDTTPPRVISTSPPAGATGVGTGSEFQVTFSEKMDPASISSTTIVLVDVRDNPVTGNVTYADRVATFRPIANLEGLTAYAATVTTGARDAEGNALTEPYAWSFSTGVADDIWPPTVSETSPTEGETCVPTETGLTANFDESVAYASVNSSTFTLRDGAGNLISSSVGLDWRGTAHFFPPSTPLANSSTYTATITRGIVDLAGNHLAADHNWTFATEAVGSGTWRSISATGAPAPGGRAVWTGTEVIVWGGDAGARYDPASDTWRPVSAAGAPEHRGGHVAVWTGSRMIVWGGVSATAFLASGGIYDPATDSWTSMSSNGAPSGRSGATAAWSGTEMLVWGGSGRAVEVFGDGAKYNPATDTWSPISETGAPSARYGHGAVWTGSAMLVWGGANNKEARNDGAMYFPSSNTWSPISLVSTPSARHLHSAVWTGSEMIVWGGYDGAGNYLGTGARFDPNVNSWRPISSRCAPLPRAFHLGVWTGTEMIVWGGGISNVAYYLVGGRYNPTTDSWQPTPVAAAPGGRFGPFGIWTGTEMVVWGGTEYPSVGLNNGGGYRPQ